MSETIQAFPRSFALGDSPRVACKLYTDEQELDGATAVADLYRLEISEPVAIDLEADATEAEPGTLILVCDIPPDVTGSLSAGAYFLRFRVTFAAGAVLTIPPDDRLRLRVLA